MDHVEMDKMEMEIKRLEKMSLILADRLNEKIDECEGLKAENLRLEAAINRILDNYSDGDLVIEVSSEALYGDRSKGPDVQPPSAQDLVDRCKWW